jgi:sulfoxide reductase heme-binding subunit YedZ
VIAKHQAAQRGWRLAAHGLAWLLAAWLAFDALTGRLGVNPIQAATQRAGKDALILLTLSLAMTPLNTLFKWKQALGVRRALGLYAFLFALAHFFIVIGVDYQFNWGFLQAELIDKRYIIVGAMALTILLALAITSFDAWKVRLGKGWKRLHKLVYLAAPLVILHYAWARKGDIFRLQGDVVQPLLFGLALAALLILRLPAIRKRISRRG